ncbi:crosslink repair DNA glycosylase YcaQ family protein [Deinococcus deserti]|uniref:Winged helix-turn-helix domain-containing protein n=1 Tax=Deinococcus deserti (strain DSM 17065 / CIP 109153 / LMG 22923 / VCD115) TaxID=546414 RepID=C1CWA5_DEIDV|nr:crosslink repair DNA glycosylase YcaQ family protein [Deinococcus deserti]ACO46472.1 hypothetical protein Deide_15160 [Deinococcus deserti VCD115]
MTAHLTPATLRAAAFSTFGPRGTLQGALDRMGFVQADPIRAPARAQDLTLMQRVRGYRAGDLERLYPKLDAEEDMLPNYGFVPRQVQALLHPRVPARSRAELQHPELFAQVRAMLHERGELHPRDVSAALGQSRVTNAWGGQSSATTRALEALHYSGEARVTRRVGGVRLYAAASHLQALREAPLPDEQRLRGAVHLLAGLYGPLPEASLGYLISLSRFGFPHLHGPLRAVYRQVVKDELQSGTVEGMRYVWRAEQLLDVRAPRGVRIVGPFDPLVWDRRRFTHLHGWTYRFEAYTPLDQRRMGYYALPVFQAERAVGWANLSVNSDRLQADFGFVPGVRQTATLRRGLETELGRYQAFLGLRG